MKMNEQSLLTGESESSSSSDVMSKNKLQSVSFSHNPNRRIGLSSSSYHSMPTRTRARTNNRSTSTSRHRKFSMSITDPRSRRMTRSMSEKAILTVTPRSPLKHYHKSKQSERHSLGNSSNDETDYHSTETKDTGDTTIKGDSDGAPDEQALSRFQIYALTINFIIGVGVLDLPFIFYKAGIVLCIILVILATFGSNLMVTYILESQSRGIMRLKKDASPKLAIEHWYKLELSEMCEIFVGNWFKFVFMIVFYIFQTSTLWSYAAVFSQTAASIVSPAILIGPDGNRSLGNQSCGVSFDTTCSDLYYTFLSVFAICEVIMTVIGLEEQAIVQTILAIYRFAAIFVMALLAIIGLALGRNLHGGDATPQVCGRDAAVHMVWFCIISVEWNGFAAALPSIIFGQLLQMAIPGLMDPMPKRDKAPCHFLGAFCTTGGCYIFLSTLMSIYLGCRTQSPVTLNFNTFLGFMNTTEYDQAGLGSAVLIQIVKYFIIVFPCLDLFSAFSLNAIVLANNLLDLFPESFIEKMGFKRVKIGASFFVALVPIILAFIAHSLEQIINIAGTTGMLLMFFFPSMIQYFSIKFYEDQNRETETVFTPKVGHCYRCFFTKVTAIIFMCLGWVLFGLSFISIIVSEPAPNCTVGLT